MAVTIRVLARVLTQSRRPLSTLVARSPVPHPRQLATAAASSSSSSSSSAPSSAHPPSESSVPPSFTADPRLSRIVDDISDLTLLQAADLVSLLKTRLNIQEIALSAAPAFFPATASASSPAEDDVALEEKPKEKTIFNLTLKSFEATSKPKIIREVKALVPNLTLIDAKKLVESVPKMLKENLPKEDAEKLKKTFEDLGAVVVLD